MPHLPAPPPRPPAKPIWTMDSCGRLASVCFKMVVILLLGLVCFLLTQKEDRVSVLQSASPSPPTPPTTSPTPPTASPTPPTTSPTPSTTASSSTTYEYKTIYWETLWYEGCESSYSAQLYYEYRGNCWCGSPLERCSSISNCSHCGGESNKPLPLGSSSFVDVMKSEGLTTADIFTDCSFPTVVNTFTKYYHGRDGIGWQGIGAGADTVYERHTFGDRWTLASNEVKSCVMTKLYNKLGSDGWSLESTVQGDSTLHLDRTYWFTWNMPIVFRKTVISWVLSKVLYEPRRRIYDPSLSLGGYTKVHTKEQGYMGSLLRRWKVRRRATHLGLQGDVIVSNPPFSKLPQILERLAHLNKPFILIMPSSKLNTQYFKKLFADKIQIIVPEKRINFLRQAPVGWKSSCNFDCFYYCFKMKLPKDIIFLSS